MRKSFFGVKASFRTRKRNNWGIFKREEKGNFRAFALKTPLDFVSVALASRQKPADFSCWRVLLHRDQRPDTGQTRSHPRQAAAEPGRPSVRCLRSRSLPLPGLYGAEGLELLLQKGRIVIYSDIKGPLASTLLAEILTLQ